MIEWRKNSKGWVVRMFFIFVSLLVFQNDVLATSPNLTTIGGDSHCPISETYNNEFESSDWVKGSHNSRVNRAISKSEVGANCKVLVDESRVAAKGVTVLGKYPRLYQFGE